MKGIEISIDLHVLSKSQWYHNFFHIYMDKEDSWIKFSSSPGGPGGC